MILKRGFDGLFRDEGLGVGGERNKCRLSLRSAIFQFLENRGLCGLFGLRFWYIWDFLGSKTLGMDG